MSAPAPLTALEQRQWIGAIATRLGAIPGISAVVLGGSQARGRARPGSDIDLGLYYSDGKPFAQQDVRELAVELDDSDDPVVSARYEWGPWVNGGAWLTIAGRRVDLLYRSLEHVERVIADAEAGRYELHYAQQPPFGFFSATYLGEIRVCVPLVDPGGLLDPLKRRVAQYPDALRRAVVRDYLWSAEFGLAAFARKFALRTDCYGTVACLTRAVNELVMVLFALNGRYPLNDKTALEEIAEFGLAPAQFGPRVQQTLASAGNTTAELVAAVEQIAQLARETADLAGGLYQARYRLPD